MKKCELCCKDCTYTSNVIINQIELGNYCDECRDKTVNSYLS